MNLLLLVSNIAMLGVVVYLVRLLGDAGESRRELHEKYLRALNQLSQCENELFNLKQEKEHGQLGS